MAAAACGVAATVQAEPLTVYFGTGGAPAKGIYRASFDTQTGKLGPADLAAEIGGPGFLALHSDGSMLYAVADGEGGQGVTGYRIHQPADDPGYVILQLDFPSIEQAKGFQKMLETRVWTSPEQSPALAGAPRARVLVAAPE